VTEVSDELLDIDGLCRLLGGSRPLSQATVYRGVKAGHLPPAIAITPGVRRWRRSEVLATLAAKAAERDAAA
jgi:predicted DNA-binding transcriptional regulator AlpA